MKLFKIFVLGSLALAGLGGTFLYGQAGGGSVVGVIHDPSGAVVPKAEISLTNTDTGTTITSTSSSSGEYVFPIVSIGNYQLTVVASGFDTVQSSGITVGLNKTVTVDETLKVGSASTTLKVEALSTQLETTTSQAATTIDQQTFDDLPIAMSGGARSVTAIADLMPGVSDVSAIGYGTTGAQGQEFSTTINGGQAWGGAVMYDGIPFVSANQSGDYRIQPVPVEALSEFSLVQNNFSAEYSRTPGGNLTYSTRAGGSSFHGQAYEYARNTDLDAWGYYATGPTITHQNEFGVNIGGPIDLPFLGLKKDKLYFFAFYSGFRLAGGVTPSNTRIPSLAERTGDFSADPQAIYDPNSTTCNNAGLCTRTQYQYNGVMNVMPPSAISATATEYNKYLPQPVAGLGSGNNFVATGVNDIIQDRWGGRVDYNINEKNLIHGFFSLGPINTNSYTNVFLAPISTYGAGAGNNHLGLARVEYDHTFSPSLLLHLGYGWNYDTQDSLAPFTSQVDTFGIPNALPITPQFYMTQGDGFCCQAYADTGGGGGGTNHENTYIESGFVSWDKGHHAFKFGGEYDRPGANINSMDNVVDRLSGSETAQYFQTGPFAGTLDKTTGNSYASLMAGQFDSVGQVDSPFGTENRLQYFDAYMTDNWKIAPKLTLNLGIRYDIPFTTSVRNAINGVHVASSFEPDVPNPGANNILGAIVYQGTGQYTCNCTRLTNTEYKMFQPRFGLAYKLDDKTVIHAGYGMYISINGSTNGNGFGQLADGFEANANTVAPATGTAAFTTATGYPTFTPPPFISSTYDNFAGTTWIPKTSGLPGVINDWTLSIQRQLPRGFLLDVSYVGNSAQHLATTLDNPNQLPLSDQIQYGAAGLLANMGTAQGIATGVPLPFPNFVAVYGGTGSATASVAQALKKFPQYTGINEIKQNNGHSDYNSLQGRLQRQFHNGLSLLTSFTWAKQMSTAEDELSQFNDGPQDTYGRQGEYTVALDQPPLNLTVTYDYQLPIGYQKKWLNHGIAATVLGGWAIAGIHHYQSGTALFETSIGNDLNIKNDLLRPNYVPGVSEKASWSGKFNPRLDAYINAAAFKDPAPNSFGNVSRDLPLRSTAYLDEDLSARKDFHIYESSSLQFRTDFFNAFNRSQLVDIFTNTNPDDPNFGTDGHQGNNPRTIQMSLKFLF
jgi:hypothetical protein